ncbi:hypothetical protein TWF481_002212 [Arthrobotrys musiformis]|uniref:Uncharacterized protein n=1 Tax=Arthrobotrys musiformis TaxID=47236 RepID=A0AAV9VU72_9PEZI
MIVPKTDNTVYKGAEGDSPPKSGLLSGEVVRLLIIWFIIQALLYATGVQQKLDDLAIRNGIRFRQWIMRKRQGRRERETPGLEEGGLGTDSIGGTDAHESLNDNAPIMHMDSDQNSTYGTRDIGAMKDAISTIELEDRSRKTANGAQSSSANV